MAYSAPTVRVSPSKATRSRVLACAVQGYGGYGVDGASYGGGGGGGWGGGSSSSSRRQRPQVSARPPPVPTVVERSTRKLRRW